jgi:superfamily II DNA or RNA helicase
MKIIIDSVLTLSELTDEQYHAIVQQNTFNNPEYQQALDMGRRTWGIDESITTYELQQENTLVVPRGYLSILLTDNDIKDMVNDAVHEWIDHRVHASIIFQSLDGIILREYQRNAVAQALEYEQGIIQSGTGSGKTIIALQIIQQKQQRTLILTHSKELLKQWQRAIQQFLGIECGIIGAGKNTEGDITLAMLQTLARREEQLVQLSNDYGLVIIDECHHIPSQTFSQVINQLACQYRYGLTATPCRRDGLDQLISRHIGDIIVKVADEDVHAVGGVVPVVIKLMRTGQVYEVDSWQEYITALTEDDVRNRFIVASAEKSSQTTSTLVLTDRIQHAEALSKLVSTDHLLIHGQLPNKERQQKMAMITECKLTIGTSGLLGEGLDVSAWTVLMLSMPISSEVKLLQAIGRVMRSHDNKKSAYVADFVDRCGFSIASYRKRQAIYDKKKFKVINKHYES